MISTLYIEASVIEHPRVGEIKKRFSTIETIKCHHYGEIFNRKSQNFRMQKKNPAIILAEKHKQFVLPAPDAYGLGGEKNFYFSHMLNCIYDCRYCFLQGMYRSAHYVLFVNYEGFADAIEKTVLENSGQQCFFYSGYDCDSLALEPVTQFVDFILPVFERLPDAILELRTKSTQIRGLLDRPAIKNCVVAFSLSPDNIVQSLEDKTPLLAKRIDAMQRLQAKGWQIGLRFDPLIYHDDFEVSYTDMFAKVAAALDPALVHSISLGVFRMPEKFFQNMVKLYPKEKLFAAQLEENDGMVAYQKNKSNEITSFCSAQILKYWDEDKFFPCYE